MAPPRITYPFVRPPELTSDTPAHVPVIIVGAGPVGLTAAIDLINRGVSVVLLDDDDTVSFGSRAVCYAKRTLEIWDRMDCADQMLEKGVRWNIGRIFFDDAKDPFYSFNLLDEEGYKFPGFINLQQYYVEEYLVNRLADAGATPRWKNKVVDVQQDDEKVTVTIETPAGSYQLSCDYLIAADGCRSPIRDKMGLPFEGQVFEDHFLIADIKITGDFPSERWFWFDPPFNRGHSSLLHVQPDGICRLDFQLGWNIDREAELKPERIAERVRAMMGQDVDFEFEWCSIYTFQCRRLDEFKHGRVIFAGDSAHLVSPFGARGANGGVQDADNLTWKLKAVLDGIAPTRLLESYNHERLEAAKENILNSTRATDFITPKSTVSRTFRDAVLTLAEHCPFARPFVNSGRLSVPAIHRISPLNTPDTAVFGGKLVPGAVAADGRVSLNGQEDWLLTILPKLTSGFCLLYFTENSAPNTLDIEALGQDDAPVDVITIGSSGRLTDVAGHLTRRYNAEPETCYLLRPDHLVAARWRQFDLNAIREARDRALARIAPISIEEAA